MTKKNSEEFSPTVFPKQKNCFKSLLISRFAQYFSKNHDLANSIIHLIVVNQRINPFQRFNHLVKLKPFKTKLKMITIIKQEKQKYKDPDISLKPSTDNFFLIQIRWFLPEAFVKDVSKGSRGEWSFTSANNSNSKVNISVYWWRYLLYKYRYY